MLKYGDLIGIPYLENGRNLNGVDCYGLAIEFYKKLNIDLPEIDYEMISREVIDGVVKENNSKFIRLDKPEKYCLVTLKIKPPYVSHVGVILEDCNSFLHISKNSKSVIERLSDRFWTKRIDRFWKIN